MRLSRQALAAGHLPTPMPHARPLRKGFTEQELSYAPASDDCDACTFFAGKLGRFSQCGQFSQFDKSNDQQLRFAHLQTKSHLLLNALARKRTGKAPPATKHKKIVFAAKKPKPSRPRPRWTAGLLGCWAAGSLFQSSRQLLPLLFKQRMVSASVYLRIGHVQKIAYSHICYGIFFLF